MIFKSIFVYFVFFQHLKIVIGYSKAVEGFEYTSDFRYDTPRQSVEILSAEL
jgi:hypothetical protein